MRQKGTSGILQKAKRFQKNGLVYWEEFLGNYGKKDRHEDSLFATSLALNSLIDIWTI